MKTAKLFGMPLPGRWLRWSQWLVPLAVLLLGAVLINWLVGRDIADGRKLAELRAATFSSKLQHSIRDAEDAAQLLAGMTPERITTQQAFEQAVNPVLKLTADDNLVLQWAPGGVIRLIAPLAGNEAALGLDLVTYPDSRDSMQRMIGSGRPEWSGLIKLRQGGLGILYRRPLHRPGAPVSAASFVGVINVLIPLSPMEQAVARAYPLLRISLAFAADEAALTPLWSSGESTRSEGAVTTLSDYHSPTAAPGTGMFRWQVTVAPKRLVLLEARGWMWGALALLTALSGALAHLFARHRSQSRRLLAQAQFQKALVDSAGVPIIATNVEGTITLFNPAAEGLLGYAAGELIGKQTPGLFHDPAEVAARAAALSAQLGRSIAPGFGVFTAMVRAGTPETREWTYVRKDGARLPVMLTVSTLHDAAGMITGHLGVAHDLTERMLAEQQLVAASAVNQTQSQQLARRLDEVEAANAAKSAFLAAMSHDMRTPLNVVIGYADMLQEEQLTPRQRTSVERVAKASEQLLALIGNVLDLAAIEAGQLQLQAADFSLRELLAEVGAMMEGEAARKGLTLGVAPACALDRMHGDAVRLRQCLLNLAGNAIKFSHQGTVAISATCADADAATAMLRFEVRDAGAGLPAEQLEQLFQPFRQVNQSAPRRAGGAGLGLAITEGLVRAMGGETGVTSTPGEGSTFWFTVRLARSAAAEAPAQTTAAAEAPAQTTAALASRLRSQLAGAPILVAEDEPISRLMMKDLLARHGLVAELACDGMEALEMAQLRAYAVVLMDLQMPRLDGIAATRLIHGLPGRQALPILALTANALALNVGLAREAGMREVVTKPVDARRLFAAMLDCLAPHKAPAEAMDPTGSAESAEYPGLDLATGLARWEDMPTYAEYLRLFVADYGDAVQQIRRQPAAEGARSAHRLKGAAANLALVALAQASASAEACLAAGEASEAVLADLTAAHASALVSIGRLLAAHDQHSPTQALKDS